MLGIGGARMLHALGFRIRQYHMNEGHAALLCLELLNVYAYPGEDLQSGDTPYDIPRVRELCNFTTHTPVEAGHDKFSYSLVQYVLGDFVELATLKRLAGEDQLNMTRLALNGSEYVNGVAKRHAETSRHLFPGYRVRSVTNGVHPFAWTHAAFAALYDEYLPGWCHEPELLIGAECCISDDAIWDAHRQAKQALVEQVQTLTGTNFDPGVFTLGFARRMTAYKRPELLFSDMTRLRAIAGQRPMQIVLVGKLKNLPHYFAIVKRLLKPGGLFLNHGITQDREGWGKSVGTRFINRYVFPDGDLDTVGNVQRAMEDAGFEILDVEALRRHYALTLRQWVQRLEAGKAEAMQHVSEPVYRIWRLYTAACALQFEQGDIGVYQILASGRGGVAGQVPLTRRDLYA